MALLAIAASCPFVQAQSAGYAGPTSAVGSSSFGSSTTLAQSGTSEREIVRRQQQAREAIQLLEEGRQAYKDAKYTIALEKYRASWDRIPKAPATVKQQQFIIQSIGDASIAVAMQYAKNGRYDDARQLLLGVLDRDPSNKRAKRELTLLNDPIRNNPALTPAHIRNVNEVTRRLELGWAAYDLGKFDEAYSHFSSVKELDPYNIAAEKGKQAVNKRRMSFYENEQVTVRTEALTAAAALWSNTSAEGVSDIDLGGVGEATPISDATLRNSENLSKLEIPKVSFEDTPIEEALAFLRGEARKQGIALNFVYEKPQAPAVTAADPSEGDDPDEEDPDEEDPDEAGPVASAAPIPPAIIPNLMLDNATSGQELLALMCSQAGCQYRIEDNAIVIYQTGVGVERMFRRQWKVTRGFLDGAGGDGGEDVEDDPFADGDGGGGASRRRIDPVAALKSMGVSFPKGAKASYSTSTGQLTVFNTPDNLDAVEDNVAYYRGKLPQMIKVLTKFVEIEETNQEELSFDWVINPFSVNNSGSTFVGGGSALGDSGVDNFIENGGAGFGNNYGGNGSWPISDNAASVTSGNRSGTSAVSGNLLDSFIQSGSTQSAVSDSSAPGILSLTGIFDSGSYQMIMRGLSQKKGVDIMSAPSLVARPGDLDFTPDPDPLASDPTADDGAAKIEVVRRFMYPVLYDPPELGSSTSNNNNNNNGYSGGGMPVASPANPSEWAVEHVGIILRFKVDELEGEDIIKFNRFELRVVDFEGFINFGSPITAGIANENDIEQVLLTENRIDMPIFGRRYINSNPCIYDGHTIGIGGLIEDSVQKVEDKVPILGDIPLVGRLFRSEAESTVRKNLMVFVTAEKIDPTGKPTRQRTRGTGDAPSAASAPGLFPPTDGLAQP